jgi:predicted ATPase
MISRVSLKNFKCFEDETIALAPLNLWTGLNGMGKSTFIQALLMLRQNYELGMLQSEKGISLNGELVRIGNARDLLYQYFKNQSVAIVIENTDRCSVSWEWNARTDSDALSLVKKSGNLDAIFKSSLFGPNFHYLNAERLGPRVYFEISNYDVVNRNRLGQQGEYTANYLAEFQNTQIPIPQLKHPNSSGLTLREQVNAWLGEIRPGTRIDVLSNPDFSLVGLRYDFIGGIDSGNKFRPTNVGFGLSFLLPILVAVLSSKAGTLLIMENPEAHLHPRGQAEIGKLLALAAANGIQIIVETHSDHILNGVRVTAKKGLIKPQQINLLFFHGEVIEDQFKHYILNPKIDANGKIDQWPEGFFDEWERQLTELI